LITSIIGVVLRCDAEIAKEEQREEEEQKRRNEEEG